MTSHHRSPAGAWPDPSRLASLGRGRWLVALSLLRDGAGWHRRELVTDIARELRIGDLLPERGRQLLTKLTALMGNCNQEIREADAEYAVVLLRYLDGSEAASRAKIRAEVTAEYKRKREAHDTKELTVEMIRSLKVILRSVDEEMRLGSH
jgi:hypothetical protein